jgi:hypothetical protein
MARGEARPGGRAVFDEANPPERTVTKGAA